MTHRIEKIESTLQRNISEVLQRRLSDPRLEGFISITRVQVSPDMHNAIVYVSVMPEHKQKQVIAGLHHATGRIRSLVGKSLPTKTLPHLEFRLDESLKTQARTLDAIQRGIDRSGPAPPDESPPEENQGQ
ncbi:MAG: 30S ribosome-binding factor RbfA [Phycisphaeraceae bacterium]